MTLAYQVFSGEENKHGFQEYELKATYFDKQKAFEHCERIAEETPLYGDILEFDGWYGDGKYCSWSAVGWNRVTISRMEQIEIQ
jgi:hypothetical protein